MDIKTVIKIIAEKEHISYEEAEIEFDKIWNKPIDESKLDGLAKVYYLEQLHKQESTYENTKYCMSDFKAGYRNAFNNKVNNS